jgi:membrane protein implicated in regulation of membrane protease activity
MLSIDKPMSRISSQDDQLGTIIPFHKTNNIRKWRVQFKGSDWYADSEHSEQFEIGQVVRIVGHKSSTTLLIEPL